MKAAMIDHAAQYRRVRENIPFQTINSQEASYRYSL
jgi:hypothetical protein